MKGQNQDFSLDTSAQRERKILIRFLAWLFHKSKKDILFYFNNINKLKFSKATKASDKKRKIVNLNNINKLKFSKATTTSDKKRKIVNHGFVDWQVCTVPHTWLLCYDVKRKIKITTTLKILFFVQYGTG